MSVKKTIQNTLDLHFRSCEETYYAVASRVINSVLGFGDKLDELQKPTLFKRIISVRNWLNHLLLWCILVALVVSLLSSCFVAARTAYIETPFAKAAADTVTAVIGRAYKPLIEK